MRNPEGRRLPWFRSSVVCVAVTLLLQTNAQADLRAWRAGRLIRESGRWCEEVRDMRVIKHESTEQTLVVLVTCAGRKFAQYEILLGPDGKVIKIGDR